LYFVGSNYKFEFGIHPSDAIRTNILPSDKRTLTAAAETTALRVVNQIINFTTVTTGHNYYYYYYYYY